jgi:glutaredoxin 3
MAKIVLYTVQGCGYCRRAREMLRTEGVDFEERDITSTPEVRDDLAKRSGGERSVPQIYVDDQYIGQDDELQEWIASGKLDEMLK